MNLMPLSGQYKYIMDKNHPRSYESGWVYEHIIVAETKLGRQLLDGEVVHHVDGNKLNNDPNNIIVFASTSDHVTFHHCGCNVNYLIQNKNGSFSCNYSVTQRYCMDCGKEISYDAIRCFECSNKHKRIVDRPSKEKLKDELYQNNGNFTLLSKKYHVSDNAIRKWCKSYDLPTHSKDYK